MPPFRAPCWPHGGAPPRVATRRTAPPSPLQPPPLAPLFPPPSSVCPCSHWTGYTNEDRDAPLLRPHLYLRGNGKGPFDPPPPFSRKGGMGAGTVAPFTPSSRLGEPPPFSLLRAPLRPFTRNGSAGKDASGDHAGPDPPPPFAPPPQFAREWGAGSTPCPPSCARGCTMPATPGPFPPPSAAAPSTRGKGARDATPCLPLPLTAAPCTRGKGAREGTRHPAPPFPNRVEGRCTWAHHPSSPPVPPSSAAPSCTRGKGHARAHPFRAGTPLSPLTPVFAQMAPAPPLPLRCAEATHEWTGRGMGGGAHAQTGRHVNEGQGGTWNGTRAPRYARGFALDKKEVYSLYQLKESHS
ncbi:hypothetical protein EDB85DRAFT_1893616 [Lactarius pseudohatsudake]|nr:hypothetical protein EDB85DRAFT_1893616 [Lactarius pseudohatsudake]